MRCTLENLGEFSQKFLDEVSFPSVILLCGEMGSGKTTLTRSILTLLGVVEPVTSPTFTYINEYIAKNRSIGHIDFYRGGQSLAELTSHKDFDLLLIEWPDMALDQIDANYKIEIVYVDEYNRDINWTKID